MPQKGVKQSLSTDGQDDGFRLRCWHYQPCSKVGLALAGKQVRALTEARCDSDTMIGEIGRDLASCQATAPVQQKQPSTRSSAPAPLTPPPLSICLAPSQIFRSPLSLSLSTGQLLGPIPPLPNRLHPSVSTSQHEQAIVRGGNKQVDTSRPFRRPTKCPAQAVDQGSSACRQNVKLSPCNLLGVTKN